MNWPLCFTRALEEWPKETKAMTILSPPGAQSVYSGVGGGGSGDTLVFRPSGVVLLCVLYTFQTLKPGAHNAKRDGSVLYSCCWPSPAQPFSDPSPAELMTIFYSRRLETPQVWRTTPPCTSPDTLFPFPGLVRLVGRRVEMLEPASTW
jgi:hypothetical protein